jgi:hypothetical protein
MKNWVLFGIAMLMTTSVFQARAAGDECDSLAKIAKSIMGARQGGGSMADMMHIAESTCPKDMSVDVCNAFTKLQKAIVVAAFEKPRYETPEIQQQTITDFSNAQYLSCYKASHKDG